MLHECLMDVSWIFSQRFKDILRGVLRVFLLCFQGCLKGILTYFRWYFKCYEDDLWEFRGCLEAEMHYFCKMPDTESTKRHIRPLNITFMSPHSHPSCFPISTHWPTRFLHRFWPTTSCGHCRHQQCRSLKGVLQMFLYHFKGCSRGIWRVFQIGVKCVLNGRFKSILRVLQPFVFQMSFKAFF